MATTGNGNPFTITGIIQDAASLKVIDYDKWPEDLKKANANRDVMYDMRAFKNFPIGATVILEGVWIAGDIQINHSRLFVEPEKEAPITEENKPSIEIKSGWFGEFYWLAKQRLLMNSIVNKAKKTGYASALFRGRSGYGKTSAVYALAKELGMKCVKVDVANLREPSDLFFTSGAKNGTTYREYTEFAIAMREGNCIFIFDEFNRLKPTIANVFLPLLDDTHRTSLDGEVFEMGNNIIVCGTMNEGWKFSGTYELDAALRRRFDGEINVGAMPAKQEEELMIRHGVNPAAAKKIVGLLNTMRQHVENQDYEIELGTNVSKTISDFMNYGGMTPRQSAEFAIVEKASIDYRKKITDTVNESLGEYILKDKGND